jgi:hypothetical protein
MKYQITNSFYTPEGKYSGPAGREIDEDLYNLAITLGYNDRVEIVGFVPATFRSDEELDKEIAELLAEREKRQSEKAKIVDIKSTKKEENTEVSQTTQKRGRPTKN